MEREKVSERMEEWLCDTAMRGDLESLRKILEKDNYILDKVLVGCFKGKNPLHVAISTQQTEFALKLLEIKPELAKVLDAELGTALHVASAKGVLKIVEALVKLWPEMCMARDRDGYNPLHIAAMEGKVVVLKRLVQFCPRAAQVTVDRSDTILHLCVNYNQLESLKLLLEMIRDPEFVHSKNSNGNTILHIAVFDNRREIVKHVLNSTEINVNAFNEAGWTAMDISFFVQSRHEEEVDPPIQNLLDPPIQNLLGEKEDPPIQNLLGAAGAKRRTHMWVLTPSPRAKKLMPALVVVSSLFATMAFQVGVNPSGGVWQEDSGEHLAGKAIIAYKNRKSYSCFMYFNTVGFLLSLFLILLFLAPVVPAPRSCWGWVLPITSVMTIMTTAFAYTYSVIVVSPKHMAAEITIILVSVIMWACSMIIFVGEAAIMHAPKKARKGIMHAQKKARERISRIFRARPRLLPNAVGENVSNI